MKRRILVARGENEDFLDGVDTLNERSERLEARINRLMRHLQEGR